MKRTTGGPPRPKRPPKPKRPHAPQPKAPQQPKPPTGKPTEPPAYQHSFQHPLQPNIIEAKREIARLTQELRELVDDTERPFIDLQHELHEYQDSLAEQQKVISAHAKTHLDQLEHIYNESRKASATELDANRKNVARLRAQASRMLKGDEQKRLLASYDKLDAALDAEAISRRRNAQQATKGAAGSFMLKHEAGLKEFSKAIITAPFFHTIVDKVFDAKRAAVEKAKNQQNEDKLVKSAEREFLESMRKAGMGELQAQRAQRQTTVPSPDATIRPGKNQVYRPGSEGQPEGRPMPKQTGPSVQFPTQSVLMPGANGPRVVKLRPVNTTPTKVHNEQPEEAGSGAAEWASRYLRGKRSQPAEGTGPVQLKVEQGISEETKRQSAYLTNIEHSSSDTLPDLITAQTSVIRDIHQTLTRMLDSSNKSNEEKRRADQRTEIHAREHEQISGVGGTGPVGDKDENEGRGGGMFQDAMDNMFRRGAKGLLNKTKWGRKFTGSKWGGRILGKGTGTGEKLGEKFLGRGARTVEEGVLENGSKFGRLGKYLRLGRGAVQAGEGLAEGGAAALEGGAATAAEGTGAALTSGGAAALEGGAATAGSGAISGAVGGATTAVASKIPILAAIYAALRTGYGAYKGVRDTNEIQGFNEEHKTTTAEKWGSGLVGAGKGVGDIGHDAQQMFTLGTGDWFKKKIENGIWGLMGLDPEKEREKIEEEGKKTQTTVANWFTGIFGEDVNKVKADEAAKKAEIERKQTEESKKGLATSDVVKGMATKAPEPEKPAPATDEEVIAPPPPPPRPAPVHEEETIAPPPPPTAPLRVSPTSLVGTGNTPLDLRAFNPDDVSGPAAMAEPNRAPIPVVVEDIDDILDAIDDGTEELHAIRLIIKKHFNSIEDIIDADQKKAEEEEDKNKKPQSVWDRAKKLAMGVTKPQAQTNVAAGAPATTPVPAGGAPADGGAPAAEPEPVRHSVRRFARATGTAMGLPGTAAAGTAAATATGGGGLKDVSELSVSDAQIERTKKHESFQPKPYPDPPGSGLFSIGYGHQIKPGEHFTEIDEKQATELLHQDMSISEAAIKSNIKVPLTQNMYDAMVDLGHSGPGWIQKFAPTLNGGDYKGFVARMQSVNKAMVKGKLQVLPGLASRRQQEADLFMAGAPAAPGGTSPTATPDTGGTPMSPAVQPTTPNTGAKVLGASTQNAAMKAAPTPAAASSTANTAISSNVSNNNTTVAATDTRNAESTYQRSQNRNYVRT